MDDMAAANEDYRPGRPAALLLALAAAAVALLLWASSVANPTVGQSPPVEVPPLSEQAPAPLAPDPAAAPGAGGEGSLQAQLPGLPSRLRLVVPAAGGAAEIWDWPTDEAGPRPDPVLGQPDGWLDLHAGGTWAAEFTYGGDLLLGTVERRVFQAPGVFSVAWHAAGEDRVAWLSQPEGAPAAELWTADLSTAGIFSRRIGTVPLTLGSPEPSDGGFLVAFADWGYAIERSLPTTREGDVTLPHSEIMVVSPDGVAGAWREGRLLAAAGDGRLLVGTVNVLSGTYRPELTGPELAPGPTLPWVSLGATSYSPDGASLFNMVDRGPPKAHFTIVGDAAEHRFTLETQAIHALGWSADGRYYLLAAIVPGGQRSLVIVDARTGEMANAPVARLPRFAGLGEPP